MKVEKNVHPKQTVHKYLLKTPDVLQIESYSCCLLGLLTTQTAVGGSGDVRLALMIGCAFKIRTCLLH